jgi:hypothetical protein
MSVVSNVVHIVVHEPRQRSSLRQEGYLLVMSVIGSRQAVASGAPWLLDLATKQGTGLALDARAEYDEEQQMTFLESVLAIESGERLMSKKADREKREDQKGY